MDKKYIPHFLTKISAKQLHIVFDMFFTSPHEYNNAGYSELFVSMFTITSANISSASYTYFGLGSSATFAGRDSHIIKSVNIFSF